MIHKKNLLASLYIFLAACAPFGSSSLEQRVELQDMQIRQMQPQQADTWNEVQSMRQEIAQLKGQLAELNNAGGARAIADRVRQHDAALRQVDDSMSLNLPLGTPLPAGAPVSAGAVNVAQGGEPQGIVPQAGNAPDSSAYASALPVPATAAAAPAVATAQPTGSYGLPPDPVQQPAIAPDESNWGKADPQPEPVTVQKDIAAALFEAGVNDYNGRKYEAAERSFKDYLKNYPKNGQAAEAQYYVGECLFQRNQFPQAALEYDAVIKKYPKSGSAAASYYKQAICFSKMKQPDAAKMQMQAVISKFPNSPYAARAKTFLKTNR